MNKIIIVVYTIAYLVQILKSYKHHNCEYLGHVFYPLPPLGSYCVCWKRKRLVFSQVQRPCFYHVYYNSSLNMILMIADMSVLEHMRLYPVSENPNSFVKSSKSLTWEPWRWLGELSIGHGDFVFLRIFSKWIQVVLRQQVCQNSGHSGVPWPETGHFMVGWAMLGPSDPFEPLFLVFGAVAYVIFQFLRCQEITLEPGSKSSRHPKSQLQRSRLVFFCPPGRCWASESKYIQIVRVKFNWTCVFAPIFPLLLSLLSNSWLFITNRLLNDRLGSIDSIFKLRILSLGKSLLKLCVLCFLCLYQNDFIYDRSPPPDIPSASGHR